MRQRLIAIFLAILFCFLAYLEAVAQEIAHDIIAKASLSEQTQITIAKSDISQSIDWALEIICENEGGKFILIKGVPECDFTDVEHK